eukprot:265609-Rhodomonas_salina.2
MTYAMTAPDIAQHTLWLYRTSHNIRYDITGHSSMCYGSSTRYGSTGHRLAYAMTVPGIAYLRSPTFESHTCLSRDTARTQQCADNTSGRRTRPVSAPGSASRVRQSAFCSWAKAEHVSKCGGHGTRFAAASQHPMAGKMHAANSPSAIESSQRAVGVVWSRKEALVSNGNVAAVALLTTFCLQNFLCQQQISRAEQADATSISSSIAAWQWL